MLVLSSTYTVPLAEVEPHRAAHLDWLRAQAASGTVLAFGRKDPPTGAVILVARLTPAQARDLIATDPYVLAGVAEYEITEFTPVFAAPGLEAFTA